MMFEEVNHMDINLHYTVARYDFGNSDFSDLSGVCEMKYASFTL